jgi:hypothetical protein
VPKLINLILTLLMVALPTGGRFGSVPLDEEHERDRSEQTAGKQVAGEHRELRPHGGPTVIAHEEDVPRAAHQGFVPTLNLRTAELALLGAAERRML